MDSSSILESLAPLASQLKLERLMPAVLDISLELTGAERAFLMMCDKDDELTIHAARSNKNENLSEEDFLGSTTIVKRVLQDMKALYIPMLSKDREFSASESVRKLNLKSAVCIPLWRYRVAEGADRKLLGLLYQDSSSPGRELQPAHVQLLNALANHVAISIENAELFEELSRKNQQIAQLNVQLQDKVDLQEGNIEGMRMLLAETQRELRRSYGLENIIGKSKPMLDVFRILEKVVRTNATVLILGESGTGKELVARYIHYNGPREKGPMVSVNCSAFSDTLLESELFGHRKGSFTGANENKMGVFQLADAGTLFLDEVGDMSPEMQKKLLRVLQDGEIRPIGSKEAHRVDVRIVAATHRNLKELVQQGTFREDLYFRLNVIQVSLPSLRERREDIPLLVEFFSRKIAEELQRPVVAIHPSVSRKFMEYDWPGNVRELENELRRVFILESEYLPDLLRTPQSEPESLTIAAAEKKAILKALETSDGNRTKAAEILGMPRRTFYEKLRKYDIHS